MRHKELCICMSLYLSISTRRRNVGSGDEPQALISALSGEWLHLRSGLSVTGKIASDADFIPEWMDPKVGQDTVVGKGTFNVHTGNRGFDSRRGLGIFLFTTAFRMALGPTQPPIQRVPGALSLGVKRPGREADHHSPPSRAKFKEWVVLYLHSPIRLHGVVLYLLPAIESQSFRP
jgi:hypothetical protein